MRANIRFSCAWQGLLTFRLAWLLGAIFLQTSLLRAATDYSEAIRRFTELAEGEISSGNLSGFSVAWVDDQEIVFAAGFGYADKARRREAAPDTVYRVGSISKLFAAIAAMQLAEQGKVDIDAPARLCVPEFKIVNPFTEGGWPTLRQLMCHRSGLIREAPVGGYFDASEPSAEQTVASLADCVLVHPPNTRTKYSNSGVTVVGRAVEKVSGLSFAEYQKQKVLDPMGMNSSAFLLTRDLKTRLAQGYLNVAEKDGGFREIKAPQFEFGILPAGNLYSTVEDLGRFLSCLFRTSQGQDSSIVRPETLKEMWTVQLREGTNGFGLGFAMGHHRGQRTFGHTGAVYGFSSQLIGLIEQRLGVVVLANDDLAIGPVRRLTRSALNLLLEARTGIPAETKPAAQPQIAESDLKACTGDYESTSFWARIEPNGSGGLRAIISRQTLELTPVDTLTYKANGRIAFDADLRFERDSDGQINSFTCFDQTFRRVTPSEIQEPPQAWERFTGSYGPAFIPLIVTIRHGHLYAMTENEFDYRLHPVNRTVFAMPPGLYDSEHLVFQVDRAGRAHGVLLANMPLVRRR